MIELIALLATRALMEVKHKPERETQTDRIKKEQEKLRKMKIEADKITANILADARKKTRS